MLTKILYQKKFVGLIFFLWTVTLQAQTTSLTTPENLVVNEQQAIALFYQRNLGFIAAKFNIDTARAEEIIAGAVPNPVFTFTVSTFSPKIFQAAYRANNPGAPLPAFSPQIEQLIETAGKRRLRMESRAFATEAIKFDLQDTARVLTNTVRRSYYTLLLAQKISQVADNNYEHYREIIRVNEIRLKTGDIAAISFMRIEIESLKAQADQDQARAAMNQARADLLLVLGWPENSMKILAAEIWPEANPEIALAEQDQLVDHALEMRPDMQSARARIDQAKKMLTLAERLVIPDITVGGFYQRDPGNFITQSGGVSISMPLPLWYQQEGQISSARTNLNSAELELKRTKQEVQTEVMKAVSSWQSANTIAKRFEASVIDRIEKLRKSQAIAYQKGAIGLLDLIDAERNYKIMMLDYYTTLANRSRAWADLLMAYGEETQVKL